MNAKFLIVSLFLCGCASTVLEKSSGEIISTPTSGYLDESLCSLRNRADANNLWGGLIRIEGTYQTDRQTFSWVKAQCKKGEVAGVEFTRLQSLDAAGLEPMAKAVKRRCGDSVFCAYSARVVVVGRLIKDDSAMYGMLLELVEVQSFDVDD